jgi:hypothetical protein
MRRNKDGSWDRRFSGADRKNDSEEAAAGAGAGCGCLLLLAGVFLLYRASKSDGSSAGSESVAVASSPAVTLSATTTASAPVVSAATTPKVGAPAKPSAVPTSSHAASACTQCRSQEDFDSAMKAGSKCCPVVACSSDADCQGGRVCCQIPDGQLCGDQARCSLRNRVDPRARLPR